jgi:hypothetical protein
MSNIFLKILAGIAALAVLAGIFYVIFFHDFTGGNIITGNKEENNIEEIINQDMVEEIKVQPADENKIQEIVSVSTSESEVGEESLKRIASSFSERFGSYSNHSGYSNILDLKIFMTKSMQVWADEFVRETKAKEEYGGIYYGITTKAVSAEVKKFDDDTGQADIFVDTQRRESAGEMGNATISYQSILISFIRENGSWKVNRAEWQEK